MNRMAAHLPLPCTMAAVAVARDTVAETLRGWGFHDHDWVDGVAVIVTELVTNAVRHAGGCPALDLHTNGSVTLTVTDRSPVHPQLRQPDDDGGRGLVIVDALCKRRGARDHETGKQVWVELPAYPHRGAG
jgi:anti-sigma regulatory factor (Ser/Thr protein kinase)